MICCYQITKIFRSWHDCTSAFEADVAISVLREVSKDTMLSRYHCCSWLQRSFMRGTASVSMSWNTFTYQIFLELFWPFWHSSSHFLLMRDAPKELRLPAMKMWEMWVKMSLKSLSIDQIERMVRSSPCYILSFFHF